MGICYSPFSGLPHCTLASQVDNDLSHMGHPVQAGAWFKMDWLVRKIVSIPIGWLVILERANIPSNILFDMEWPVG